MEEFEDEDQDIFADENSKVVYKYELPFDGTNEINIPKDAKILRIEWQKSSVYLWALVDTEASTEKRYFYGALTGEKLPPEIIEGKPRYVNSIFPEEHAFVLHFFEFNPK
jgi:hypothetical protein